MASCYGIREFGSAGLRRFCVVLHRRHSGSQGLGADLYNLAAQWKVQREFASEVKIRQGPLPYIRPPFEALLFSVFARWPYVTALLLWTTLKLALLATIPFIVVHGRSWREGFPIWMTGLLVLGTYPAFF